MEFCRLCADSCMIYPYAGLSIGHVSFLPPPCFPLGPQTRCNTCSITSLDQYPHSVLFPIHPHPSSSVAYSTSARSHLISIAVCSNSVAPLVMVSDLMDAPYGTDVGRAIESHIHIHFRRRWKGFESCPPRTRSLAPSPLPMSNPPWRSSGILRDIPCNA